MSENLNLKTISTIDPSPFKHLCVTIGELPSTFLESMSYYELLAWFVDYLEKTVIPAVNANGEATAELQELFIELKTFVDTYFDNLDVQEEINNKLDEMAEDGTLQEIITTYIQSNVAWTFDTVADMKQATNLVDGSYARTLGFYSKNDGGGATYYITGSGSADEMQVIAVGSLYANLVHEPSYINAKTVGCKTDDNTFDNSTIINSIIDSYNILTLYLPNGEYFINKPIIVTHSNVVIKGDIKRTRISKTSSDGVDITIQTSKGTTYNLNNYDMNFYIGKATSDADTVARVHLDNIAIKCYDNANSYGIIAIGTGYCQYNNLLMLSYNRGFTSDDSFATNINGMEALEYSNRNALTILDSTAIYVSNSYLNAGNFPIYASGSRVYADNIACDGHGIVFNILNSYFSMVNSRCETYAQILTADGSNVNITNCDLEGHGSVFNRIGDIDNSAIVNIENTNLRYRVYDGDTLPASVDGFRVRNNSVCNVKAIYNIQDNIPVNDITGTAGMIFVIDLKKDGIKGLITAESGYSITTNEIYSKDGYVNVYVVMSATNALTNGSSTKVATISRVPLPSATVRQNAFSDSTHAYDAHNPCYCSINTSGELNITPYVDGQKYFNMNFRYKI